MKKRILIVDDNSADLRLLEALLKEHDMAVSTAQNGRDALRKARRNPPGLVVTDIPMPVMDGYELCRAWKADDRFGNIPLIFYTAEPMDEAFALSLGADLFLNKPQEPEVLMDKINRMLAEDYVPKTAAVRPLGEEMEFFRPHNAVLFKKLEKKMMDLEEANRKLRLMEDLYKLSFENISETVFLIDSNLKIVNVSPSVEKIIGYKPEDFIGRPVTCLRKILTTETYLRAMADTSLVLKGETIASTIYQAVARDGKVRKCEVSGAPMKRYGRIVGIISVARDVSESLENQERVIRSEKKYRELYDFLPIPVYEMDLEGNMIAANRAVYELFGGSENDLKQGFNVWRLLSPEDREKSIGNMRRLLEGEKISGTEYMLSKPDGKVFPAVVVSSVIYGDGKPVGLRGAVIDITERRQAEEALRESEIKFKDLSEKSIVGIYLIQDGLFRYVNATFARIFGYEIDEMLDKLGTRDVVAPEDLPVVEEQLQKRLSGAIKTSHYVLKALTKQQNVRYIEVHSSATIYRGRPAAIGTVLDITDRSQAEEALRESETKFKDLSEKSIVGIYLVQDDRYQYMNATFARILGYEIEDMLGVMGPKDVIHPEDWPLVEEYLRKRLSGEIKYVHYEFRIRTKQGAVRYMEVHSSSTVYRGRPAAIGTMLDITDRKLSEGRLRESEERYRSVFENHSAVKFLIDPDSGGIVEANDAAVKYYGWPKEKLLQMKIHEINTLSPEDIKKELGKARNREKTYFEFRHRRADGSIRDVEVYSGTIDIQGRKLIHSIVHDITERKRSEALYQVLAESSMGAIFIVQDGKFRFINKNAIAYTGYTEDIRGRDADIMIHPEDKAMCSAYAKEMLNGLRTTAYEYRIVTKGNRIRWISQILTPIVYDGRLAILGNALDVTDLKESQARLAEITALESSIMSAIPHVVLGLQNSCILFVNDAAESVFGWKPEELIGRTLDVFCQDENECRDLTGQFQSETVNETPARREAEIHCRHRDGRNIVCKVTSCRTGESAGGKIVAIFEDVTAKKMSQIQLLQAEKMASIGKLAAGVAHEINNPTAFVSSNLNTLSEYVNDMIAGCNMSRDIMRELQELGPGKPVPGAVMDRLRQIKEFEAKLKMDDIYEDAAALIAESREGTGRIARIVQDLKNFAHPGEEKETSFNVNENIESTLNIVWNELKYKASVRKDYGDIPRVLGYPQQLNQVFMNLLVNAAQAIKDKGEIRISTKSDGGYIEIGISDTGVGIPPENLPKLFDPFFTTKEVGKGTGLGLHVAYSIIEKHNGSIDVESTVGAGTTFTVRIPIHLNS